MSTAQKLVDALLESDPKDLALRASTGLSPDTRIKFQCPFTDVGAGAPEPHVAKPNYFSDEVGDWQPDWNQAEAFRLGDYIKDGVLDLNDFPFGTETVIVVNPDGSPGPEYTIEDLALGTAEVIDSYVSQDQDNEEYRDAHPDEFYPRARPGEVPPVYNYEQGREGG